MSSKPFVLSVKVVIRDDAGRCLLLKRSPGSRGNPGKWEFPGGKAELGENFDDALLREVGEETGLAIRLTHVAGAAEFELPARRIAYIIMEGSPESGEVRLSEEHDDFTWVPVRDLPSVDIAEQFAAFARTYAGSRS